MNQGFTAALSTSVAIAFLAGCGGSPLQIGAPGMLAQSHVSAARAAQSLEALVHHKTFHYSGKRHSFFVPAGVSRIDVVARGAAGGGNHFGRGGRVHAVIPVQPGETLYIFVGGHGSATGGFNGGGNPGTALDSYGYGGGGASDVREGGHLLTNRILVAAGGGAQGCCHPKFGDGGDGGRDVGQAGGSAYDGTDGGGGGSQSQGGPGGLGESSTQNGFAGSWASGGDGGNMLVDDYCNSSNYECYGGSGGGGGGGYYGGGGGAGGFSYYWYGDPGAGGGGGSSYVEPSAIKVHLWRGWKDAKGDGLVVFSW